MIPQVLLDEAKEFARQQAEQYGTPSFLHTEFACEQGQRLAKHHGADVRVVWLGTYLMDAMLGKALAEGKQSEHVQWAEAEARQLIDAYADVSEAERNNVLACIRQHHGASHFDSLEAEICCNADCYKFTSVRGVIIGMQNGRKMPVNKLVQLYKEKLEEKWRALSLQDCKAELLPQYQAIGVFLEAYS